MGKGWRGHCQVNGTKSRFSPKRRVSHNSSTDTRDLSPVNERSVLEESMMNGLKMMSTDLEQVLGRTVNGEIALGLDY
jgi:hypothetical protein